MESRMSGSLGFDAGRWPLDVNKPTLVFIHGSSQNRLFWRSQVQALVDVANTVAIDLPGHGTSPGPGNDHVSDNVRAVVEFLDQANIPRPIPCGLSLGGAITLELLIDHGERFPAGILMNTGARLKVNPLILETIQKDFDKYVESLLDIGISKKSDAEALWPLIQETSACTPEVALGDYQACNRFDVMDRLHLIKTPVLVLTAADDVLTPVKYGHYMARKDRRGNRALHIEDAGHLSPLEKPDQVNQAIRHFLQRLPD